MTKAELDFLENVFAANLEGRLIQSKSMLAKRLETGGYIVLERKNVGKDRFGDIMVEGYSLTIKGNMAYCTSERCTSAQEEL